MRSYLVAVAFFLSLSIGGALQRWTAGADPCASRTQARGVGSPLPPPGHACGAGFALFLTAPDGGQASRTLRAARWM